MGLPLSQWLRLKMKALPLWTDGFVFASQISIMSKNKVCARQNHLNATPVHLFYPKKEKKCTKNLLSSGRGVWYLLFLMFFKNIFYLKIYLN
jgi:hypothetical protein